MKIMRTVGICIYYFVYIQNGTEDENLLESVINVNCDFNTLKLFS